MSRAQLASSSHVGYSTIAAIENNDVRSTTKINQLAKALGVTVDWLATGDEPGYGGVAESAPPYGQPSLSPDEKAILDLWRGLDADGRKALQTVGHALAKPRVKRSKDAAR